MGALHPNKVSNQPYRPKKDRSHKSIVIVIISFFIGTILTLSLYFNTLISLFDLSKFFIGFAVIGFLIPLKFYSKWFHFIKYEMILLNIMGVAPTFTGLFLLINYMIVSDSNIHDYKIENIHFEGNGNHKYGKFILEGNVFSEERKIVGLDDINPKDIISANYLRLELSNGLFGYKVIRTKELITL